MRFLAEAQLDLGHDVMAIADESIREAISKVPVKHIPYTPCSLFNIRSVFLELSPDIVHVSAPLIPMDALFSGIVHIAHKVPVVISPHGVLNPLGVKVRFGGKPRSRLAIILKRIFILLVVQPLLRSARLIHAEAQYEAKILRKMGAKRVIAVPMGINEEWVREPRISMSDCRTFTYLGRLDIYHKCLDLILQSAEFLMTQGYKFKIRLVGSDVSGSMSWLIEYVSVKRLTKYVSIEPPTWGIRKEELFEYTDFFWGVFRYAGMARACGEACGRGIPLIVSREGNWGDWVAHSNIGIVTQLTVDDISAALIKAIQLAPQDYEAMSVRAFKYAKSNTWSAVAEQFIASYESAML
ncbi:MAG: glycosyltransferase [Deltaproteobacteria bacterium]|nr:glycosyltransferase [Deltaproteobacteria bacterium]MBW2074708.1 glycosyltransferase [Deltaproteobacteria bacterium]